MSDEQQESAASEQVAQQEPQEDVQEASGQMTREPYVGATVILRDPSRPSNSTLDHPAIVNRVWGPECVNVTAFPDCGNPYTETSVVKIDPETDKHRGWYWPTA